MPRWKLVYLLIMNELFKNLKVVELASVLAGPAVGLFFAELGASVTKIENKKTKGDVTRSWKLPSEDQESSSSAYFKSTNWNKKSLFLDLTDQTDYDLVIDLIRDADIVISNYKQGSAKKLKLDFDTLKNISDKLIYGEISSYGENDPRPGFDVVMQAQTGWISMTGTNQNEAAKLPVALIDILTAHQLKEGLLIALMQRPKILRAQKVSVSLYDTSIASLANQGSNYLNVEYIPQRIGTKHPNIAPYGDIVKTSDDRELILSVGTELQFKNLAKSLNKSELAQSSLFETNKLRVQNRDLLMDQLSTLFKLFTYMEISELLIQNEVPFSPINNLKEVFEDPMAQNLVYKSIEDGIEVKRVKSVVFKIS